MAAAKLDEYWSHLRMTDPDLIGLSLLKLGYKTYSRNTQLDASMNSEQHITLSEALKRISRRRVLASQRPSKPLPREPVVIL